MKLFQTCFSNYKQITSHFKTTLSPLKAEVLSVSTNKNEREKLRSCYCREKLTWNRRSWRFPAHSWKELLQVPVLQRTRVPAVTGNYDCKALVTCEITETV